MRRKHHSKSKILNDTHDLMTLMTRPHHALDLMYLLTLMTLLTIKTLLTHLT